MSTSLEILNRYRVYLQRRYADVNGWGDIGWAFLDEGDTPDDFINTLNKNPSSEWRIKYLHIITQEEWEKKLVYTIPYKQVNFH